MRTRPAILTLLLTSLLASGCETLPPRKPDVPRVELEVRVLVDSSFANQLEGLDETFRGTLADIVLEHADADLRFYPVLSEKYSKDQQRPPYLMIVKLGDFGIEVGREVKKSKEGETETVETTRWLSKLRSGVAITLEKRRPDGPPLLVDRTTASAAVDVAQPVVDAPQPQTKLRASAEAVAAAESRVAAARPGGESQPQKPGPVPVQQRDIERAVEKVVLEGLRNVIAAIDRDLVQDHPTAKGPPKK